jgi:hypothetical protein
MNGILNAVHHSSVSVGIREDRESGRYDSNDPLATAIGGIISSQM